MKLIPIAHFTQRVVLESPVVEKMTGTATAVSATTSASLGIASYTGLTASDLGLIFAGLTCLSTIVFGSIHVWIKMQHLKIARDNNKPALNDE